jgi:hypothetical protein
VVSDTKSGRYSLLNGNWQRGTGILNNELYVGRLVWNRQQFIKDPDSGRRQARLNPETKWIVEEVSHLRIVDDHLWNLVKECQQDSRSRVTTEDKGIRSERARHRVTFSLVFSDAEPAAAAFPKSAKPTTVAPPPATRELVTTC